MRLKMNKLYYFILKLDNMIFIINLLIILIYYFINYLLINI